MPKVAGLRAERARRREFERLVRRVLERLPDDVQAMFDNVEVVVDDEPTPRQLRTGGVEGDGTLFGLYEGVPLTERTSAYSLVLPDKITIFRGPIERTCATPEEMADQVRITVIHELAHHMGIDEDRLDELGWS